MRSAPPQGVVCPDSRADGEIGPWLRSHDDLWEARRASATPIATAHRSTIARTPKLPTFLPYSTVPVAQSAAVSLNLGPEVCRCLDGFPGIARIVDDNVRSGAGCATADTGPGDNWLVWWFKGIQKRRYWYQGEHVYDGGEVNWQPSLENPYTACRAQYYGSRGRRGTRSPMREHLEGPILPCLDLA